MVAWLISYMYGEKEEELEIKLKKGKFWRRDFADPIKMHWN